MLWVWLIHSSRFDVDAQIYSPFAAKWVCSFLLLNVDRLIICLACFSYLVCISLLWATPRLICINLNTQTDFINKVRSTPTYFTTVLCWIYSNLILWSVVLIICDQTGVSYQRTDMVMLINRCLLSSFSTAEFRVELVSVFIFLSILSVVFCLLCLWKLRFTLNHNPRYFRIVQSLTWILLTVGNKQYSLYFVGC